MENVWETVFLTNWGDCSFLVRYKSGQGKLYFLTKVERREKETILKSYEIRYTIQTADKFKTSYTKELKVGDILHERMEFVQSSDLDYETIRSIEKASEQKLMGKYFSDDMFKRLSQFIELTKSNSCAYENYRDWWNFCSNGIGDIANAYFNPCNEVALGGDCITTVDSGTTITVNDASSNVLISVDDSSWSGLTYEPEPAVPAPMENKQGRIFKRKKKKRNNMITFGQQQPKVLKRKTNV